MNHHDPENINNLLTSILGRGYLSEARKRQHLDRLGLTPDVPGGYLPAATPTLEAMPETHTGATEPRGPVSFIRRYAELAAILMVFLLVGGGIYVYQSTLSNEPSPAARGAATDEPPAITDPVEFVMAYERAMDVRDMDTVRAMLTEQFREFSDDRLYRMPIAGEASGIEPDWDDWTVEHNERFTVVRFTDMPTSAYVLRSEGDAWLVDLGESRYWWLLRRTNDDTDDFGGQIEGVEVESLIDGLEPGDASRLVMTQLLLVDPGPDRRVDVTISWGITGSQTVEFSMDGAHWVSGDETGSVEIAWANSRIVDGTMSFPEVPDDGTDGIPAYTTTFSLLNVPAAGGLELHIPDMSVTTLDGDEVTLSTIIRFPNAEYPPMRS